MSSTPTNSWCVRSAAAAATRLRDLTGIVSDTDAGSPTSTTRSFRGARKLRRLQRRYLPNMAAMLPHEVRGSSHLNHAGG